MGGFQRVALDEAYGFSKFNQKISLILLEELSIDSLNNFYLNEVNLINKFNLEIKIFSGNRWKQFTLFKHLIDYDDRPKNFISHSLRATVLIRLASFLSKSRINLVTIIHQLPSMSAPVQRFKRFFYASFSNVLFTFSEAARLDWNICINSNLLYRILFRKKFMLLLRNGIFLDRINSFEQGKLNGAPQLRLIFLGRPTSWKGIDTILKLVKSQALSQANILFIIPYKPEGIFNNLSDDLLQRISVMVGKSFKEYEPNFGDVHLYPTNYGVSAQFIESISLNCLEMASIGIPSLVTKNGLLTWPEFLHHSLFVEVDWSDTTNTVQKIFDSYNNPISISELNKVRKIISVENHINQLMKFMI
jgi:glycosyltransferase involved in cell wall biosynthesis